MRDHCMMELKSPVFCQEPFVQHGFMTRWGGVSAGDFESLNFSTSRGDRVENVRENQQRVASFISASTQLVVLNQIHSNIVHVVDSKPGQNLEGDGLVTRMPSLALGIQTADCAPVLFVDPMTRIIGACHAGWRGALSGVVQKTVGRMLEIGANLSTLQACVGPSIGLWSYEVDAQFQDVFLGKSASYKKFFYATAHGVGEEKMGNKILFSLRHFVADQLHQSGVSLVSHVDVDTYSTPELFFSYRRSTHQGTQCGGQLSFIHLSAG